MRSIFLTLIICLAMLPLGGCFPSSRPEMTTNYYTLDYAAPALDTSAETITSVMKISRFTSTQEFNTQDMLFSPQGGVLRSYNYSRWRVYPADLCGDYLARDMRQSGVFQAVVQNGLSRFRLEGALEEFVRIDGEAPYVALAINCTLLDNNNRGGIDAQVIFQRTYRHEVRVGDDSPLAMAQGLSQAMALFSKQVQEDIYLAISSRGGRGDQ